MRDGKDTRGIGRVRALCWVGWLLAAACSGDGGSAPDTGPGTPGSGSSVAPPIAGVDHAPFLRGAHFTGSCEGGEGGDDDERRAT